MLGCRGLLTGPLAATVSAVRRGYTADTELGFSHLSQDAICGSLLEKIPSISLELLRREDEASCQ